MVASTPTRREEFVYMAKLAEMVEFMDKVSSSVESRGNEDHVAVIHDYRSKIEAELSNICDGILKLLDMRLVPFAASSDSKVFYLKMKGDYHRVCLCLLSKDKALTNTSRSGCL